MKSAITLFVIGILIFTSSCKKEDPSEPSSTSTTNTTTTQPPPPYANYWGCWREATGKPGVYDIILTENQTEPHTIHFGNLCIADSALTLTIGVFRNDTLILDNGIYEFWCFLIGDTMLYSAYVPNAIPEKFIKI